MDTKLCKHSLVQEHCGMCNPVTKDVSLSLTNFYRRYSFLSSRDLASKALTWGEATIADHEERVRVLLYQASGTVDTAKRHKAAVIMLTGNKLNKLNEVIINGIQ